MGAKSPQQWLYTKYDGLGRVIMSGIYADDQHSNQGTNNYRQAFQNIANNYQVLWETRNNNTATGYSNSAMPQGSIVANLSISYYDDYTFPGNPFIGSHTAQSNMTRGLPTGTKVYQTDGTNPLYTVMYYDSKGRVVQTKSQNHLNGTDQVDNSYSFVGELLSSTRTHIVGSTTTTIANTYEYDHIGRKKQTSSSINGAAATILSQLSYNEIGQLRTKAVGNGLNTTTHSYNERGWLTNLTNNNVGFSETLKYNNPEIGTTAQYNGNIANQLYTNGASNVFSYTYDKLNRLINSTATGLGEQISYDVMGNITQMVREGYGTNNYTGYNGNQLTAITGFTNGSYFYDDNGNVKTGPEGLSLTYNYLNLPSTATKTNTGLSSSYVYDATGQKLRKQSNLDGTSDYVSGIHYENNSVAFIQTEEGRALAAGGGNYNYQYNLNDHLGNVRVSFWRNPNSQSLEVVQQDNYYAFGLRKAVSGISPDNKYLYNGKELQNGLDQLDYGARFYDPVIGRWNVVDALAEKYAFASPYNYVLNNPLKYIDPDGNDIILSITKKKQGNHSEVQVKSTMNLTIVGSVSKEQIQNLKDTYAKSFSGEFPGSMDVGKGYETYRTKVISELSITVVDNIDNAKSTDHIMLMTDNIPKNGHKVDPVGLAEEQGTSSAVEKRTLKNGSFAEVATHELGHNLGLSHTNGGLMNETVNGQSNLLTGQLKLIYGGAATLQNGTTKMYNDSKNKEEAKKFKKDKKIQ